MTEMSIQDNTIQHKTQQSCIEVQTGSHIPPVQDWSSRLRIPVSEEEEDAVIAAIRLWLVSVIRASRPDRVIGDMHGINAKYSVKSLWMKTMMMMRMMMICTLTRDKP